MSTFQAVSEAIEGSEFGVGGYDDENAYNHSALFLIQVITSFLSVFATIVVVRISVPKLDSTYQRYIFMLNIALLVNSIFLGLHPILTPNDSGGYWSIGNTGTCTATGFFLVFGSIMVSMYHTAIAFYFYFSVATIQGNYNNRNQKKKKNGNERRVTRTSGSESSRSAESSTASENSDNAGGFGSMVELISNMVCLFFPAIFAGTAATLDYLDFNHAMNLCTVYGSNAFYEDGWMIMRNIFVWTLVVTSTSTVLITIVVRCRVRFFQKKEYDDDVYGGVTSLNNKNSNASGSSLSNPDGAADNFERQIIGQKLSAIAAQCLFYTISYATSYLWFIVLAFISAGGDNEQSGALYAFQMMTVIFYPLLGVFNCAIYVRPRVQMLQIMYPEDSKLAILRVAMSKAGDPEEIEEVRAKIYGSDYYAPEDDDDAASDRSGARGGGEKSSNKLQIPDVVQFDQPSEKRESLSAVEDDDKDSVSQISDM